MRSPLPWTPCAATWIGHWSSWGPAATRPGALFLYSLLIILREGFEAILVVTALLAHLIKTGHGDKRKVIYNSVLVALALSVVTAVFLEWVFRASAAG